MNQNNNNYNAESVQTLEGLTPFRKSPGMYIGATNEYGLHHIVKEIVNNSVDEFLNANCSDIYITLLKDGGIRIEDNGRGFPHGMLDDTFSILGGCFGKEHTGGKFNNSGDSGYNTSGGMHGIGCKCAAALGIKTIAISHRDGIEELVEFSQGKMLKQITNGKCNKNLHGTSVTWYPDKEIFTDTITFNRKKIETELCQEYSFLNSGLKFHITDEKDGYSKEYYSENGIKDYLDFLNGNDEYILSPICLSETDGNFSIELGIAYNTKYSSSIKLYTNSIPQSKGTHLTGFKAAWTSAINKFAKENKWLKATDSNLTGDNLTEGQLLIINFKMIDPIFEGQIKENLTSTEGRTYTQKLITSSIDFYLNQHKNEIKNIVDKALLARKAAEAAKKARDAAREQDKKKKEKVLKFDSKLADCYSKDRLKCEIYITEGDSASGGLKTARKNEFQAVMPVRGKIINTQKATLAQIQKNAEIMTMIDAFGLRIDPKTMKVTYDKEDLRYGKIIIASDADVDGAHIKNLFYTFIWNFCPDLIRDGYVYALIAPLYRIIFSNGDSVYLKNDEELKKWKSQYKGGKKYEVKRMKGLGEMDPDEIEATLANPETRTIQQITVDDDAATSILFEQLMGTGVQCRKAYIKEHSKEATYNAE